MRCSSGTSRGTHLRRGVLCALFGLGSAGCGDLLAGQSWANISATGGLAFAWDQSTPVTTYIRHYSSLYGDLVSWESGGITLSIDMDNLQPGATGVFLGKVSLEQSGRSWSNDYDPKRQCNIRLDSHAQILDSTYEQLVGQVQCTGSLGSLSSVAAVNIGTVQFAGVYSIDSL